VTRVVKTSKQATIKAYKEAKKVIHKIVVKISQQLPDQRHNIIFKN